MNDTDTQETNAVGRVAGLLLVLGLSLANSALFYLVIWDMLSPTRPYTVILFFVSGGAHLVYFFMPWFARAMLAPLFSTGSNDSTRYGGGAELQSSNFFVSFCTIFGLILCASAFGLWGLQLDWHEHDGNLALITKENCLQIGGQASHVGGKLICTLPKSDIGSGQVIPTAGNGQQI